MNNHALRSIFALGAALAIMTGAACKSESGGDGGTAGTSGTTTTTTPQNNDCVLAQVDANCVACLRTNCGQESDACFGAGWTDSAPLDCGCDAGVTAGETYRACVEAKCTTACPKINPKS